MSARPFVKWAGGKASILARLLELSPPTFKSYHEPFLGGGAMFFGLAQRHLHEFFAYLSDTNAELMRTWSIVQEKPRPLIKELGAFKGGERAYYRVRASEPTARIESAARFIYLNKTGYNGLYRVNRSGGFNVPWGGKKKGKVWLDAENITACSSALHLSKQLINAPFQSVMSRVSKGDFVYFDPPYVPIRKTSFTNYSSAGFGLTHHRALRDVAAELKKRGVHVMISNSNAKEVHELYKDGFDIQEVHAARSINSKGDGRGKITDLIIR